MQIAVDTLIIELSTVPFDKRPVFITGSFCKWLPDLEEYRMTMVSPGNYRYQFPEDLELPDPLEYKYTRGGWDQVELDQAGKLTVTALSRRAKHSSKTMYYAGKQTFQRN